ncbi:MAG: NAD(P)(+) transhydrogenase (Re/Si-specific) subunit beta [Bacteroidia bacterium]|nr:NAD(P)(+) transhydrogenase (Re/Si-specific) subunit beta [Bacteroidia bacterium]
MHKDLFLGIIYLLGSLAFIVGLKRLSSPKTARTGNLVAAAGMLLAIIGTIVLHEKDGQPIGNIVFILAAMAVGTGIGWYMAIRVKMTKMPEMVSFFNGMGGACAAVISIVEFNTHPHSETGFLVVVFAGLMIGSVSFSGSLIAYAKLAEKIKDIFVSWLQIMNLFIVAGIIALIVVGVMKPEMLGHSIIWIIFGVSLVYGVLFVLPIGGADMPVVISLLNSFTGVAAALGGFLYGNEVMLTGGILVGSAGTILTVDMCRAMNRPLSNVLIGAFGGGKGGAAQGSDGDQVVKEISITDAAILCRYAQKVSIIPGYGLAVAQAQHVCHEFEKILEEKGVTVNFPIHPVAGRMPGHMNVLLAEADVPYPKLIEMDDANPQMPNTDVVLVLGANDVVNPAAENDPSSPIYGMPIIQAEKAKNVIVIKRSMSKGYAGIQNQLFFRKNTRMLFGDAKDALEKLIAAVKDM